MTRTAIGIVRNKCIRIYTVLLPSCVASSMTHLCDNTTWSCTPIYEVITTLCADLVSTGDSSCELSPSDAIVDSIAVVVAVILTFVSSFLGYKLYKNSQIEVMHATLFDGEENDFQI